MSDERRSSCIEDLSSELWLDIFDYLDSIKLFLAFYGLNERINRLLVSEKFLSLSNSLNSSSSIGAFFQEHPLKRFKQVRHLKLTYTYLTEDELRIINHLSSFSTLTSLHISLNADQENIALQGRFIQILFRQYCPVLQRLYVYGFKNKSEIMNRTFGFYFPSLLYIHVDKMELFFAFQILNRCRQLRSFSSELYCYGTVSRTMRASSTSPLFRFCMPSLNITETGFSRLTTVTRNFHVRPIVPLCRQRTRAVSRVVQLGMQAKHRALRILTRNSSGFVWDLKIGPGLNNKSLTNMTKLHLKGNHYTIQQWDTFLERFLACCPNLCTFFFHTECDDFEITLLDANWWTKVLAFNKKLQRISLHLNWSTRDLESDYHYDVIQSFQSSTYFTRLKANATYDEGGTSSCFIYHFYIEN